MLLKHGLAILDPSPRGNGFLHFPIFRPLVATTWDYVLTNIGFCSAGFLARLWYVIFVLWPHNSMLQNKYKFQCQACF